MKKKILIVDDEHGICLLLQEVFKDEGYNVITAKTGKKALDIIKEQAIDLIIIDYKLPVIDGIEVLRELEKNNYSIPAILMSGMFETLHKDIQGMSLIKFTLAKPFDIDELTQRVSSLIN